MKKIFFTLLILIFVACANSNKKEDEPIKIENSAEDIVKKTQSDFKVLNSSSFNLSKLTYDGSVVDKRIWQDSNGENIALFTHTTEALFVYHYTKDSDTINLLREVYDFEKKCDYDLVLEFIKSSILVTDLDSNNLGELTFAYKKACISDVSPIGLKLLILENGNKFIIRGTTLFILGEEKIGGDKHIDPSFENAPNGFLSHANKIWDKHNKINL